MAAPRQIPALFVLTGLAGEPHRRAPVPTAELAALQLRAANHRAIHTGIDPGGDLADALTADDFLLTDAHGRWQERAAFLAGLRDQPPCDGAACHDLRVRLFGPVAVVHGLWHTPGPSGAVARLRFTDVHVWQGAGWRLVGAQNTLLQDHTAAPLHTATAPVPLPWTGQDPVGDDLTVLHDLNAHYVEAFRNADVAWYEAHLAPDYVVVSSDGTMQDRAAALTDFAKPHFATTYANFPVDDVRIRRFHDVALVHASNHYLRKDGRTGTSRYTDIWHRHDGRWRCVAAHITAHTPMP